MSTLSALVSVLLATSVALAQAGDPAAPAGGAPPAGAAESMPGGPPEDAPMDLPPGFEAIKPPSVNWKAEETSPESVKKGEAAIAAVAKAYASAAAVEDSVKLVIVIPGGGEQTQDLTIAFGPSGSARITAPDAIITRVGDDLFFEPGPGSPKYMKVTKAGSLADAMNEAFGGSMMPLPQVALRTGDGADAAQALGGPFVPEAKIVGFRGGADGKGGVVYLKEGDGEAEVAIDPASGRLAGIAYSAVPPGAPKGFRVPITMVIGSAAFEKDLPKPIAFDGKGRKAVASIEALQQALEVGEPAPEFKLKDTEGKEVSLTDLKGSVVVIDFWATWCGPCMKGLPKIDEFAKWSAGKPVKVFAINTMENDEGPEQRVQKIAGFWKSKGFSFPTLIDGDDQLSRAYGVQGIPFTVVIDPQGRVADVHTGLSPTLVDDLKKATEAALAAQPKG
jgi:thiol-disulfide isomerase/thioredoxin